MGTPDDGNPSEDVQQVDCPIMRWCVGCNIPNRIVIPARPDCIFGGLQADDAASRRLNDDG